MLETSGADTMGRLRRFVQRVRQSRIALTALLGGGALLMVGLAFWAGIAVGAGAGRRPAQPPGFFFGRPFGGPRGQMGHGAFGSITNIDGNSITIMDPRFGQPRTVSISPATLIERGNHERVQAGDLRVGDNVTVIGSPTNGNTIDARYIGVGQESPMDFEWHHAPPGSFGRGSSLKSIARHGHVFIHGNPCLSASQTLFFALASGS